MSGLISTNNTTAMPSSTSSGGTDYRRRTSEAGPGFTAVNLSPPPTRGMPEPGQISSRTNGFTESSATSPDLSPRHDKQSAGRSTPATSVHVQGYDSQHKRKRSLSAEQASGDISRRYDYNPPRKDMPQQLADRALHVMDSAAQPQSRPVYATSEPVEHPAQEYERPYAPETPEGRLQDAMQRDGSDYQQYGSSVSGVDHDQSDIQLDGSPSQMQQASQKRKRNFSNRTKTGCITCRTRKKKCDEGRPECNNCTKGGFTCQGYSVGRQSAWTKPMTGQKPIALQSKEADEQGNYTDSPVMPTNASSNDATQVRSAAMDGHEQVRPVYTPSQGSAEARPAYPGQPQQHQPPPSQSWQQHTRHNPSGQSYTTEHLAQYADFSQQSQHNHQGQSLQHQSDYSVARGTHRSSSSRDMQSRAPSQSVSAQDAPMPAPSGWQSHNVNTPSTVMTPQTDYSSRQVSYPHPPIPPPRIDTSHTSYQQPLSRSSASYTTSGYTEKASSKVFSAEEIERSRMIRGAQYNYFDPTLKNERLRCTAALERYNTALKLISGVSEAEAQIILARVFDPSLDTNHSFRASLQERGILGPGVIVEAGFSCRYGYNIRLGDNVFVGGKTSIDDSAKVSIGARSWIGSEVRILTNETVADLAFRRGTDGQPCIARGVEVGTECVIGTGAVIYPGVRIGRGATVEPFAVVKEDLPEGTVQKCAVGARMGGGQV